MSIKGLAIDNVGIPILSTSYDNNRNPIVEDSCIGTIGHPSICGGVYTINGQFEAAYRPQLLNTYIENGILGKTGGGLGNSTSFYEITTGNEFDKTYTFASCAFESCDISIKTKDFARITFNWLGTYKKPTASTILTPDRTYEIPIFYNAYINGLKCNAITIRIERPLWNDDYILGSEYTQTIKQNENLRIGGTITLPNKEYDLLDEVLTTTDELNWNNDDPKTNNISIGSMLIKLRNPSGTEDITTISIPYLYASTANVNLNGPSKFEKTIEWVAKTSDTDAITFT